MGGAQALAAFAYGTATVQRVDKVVGPGNQYVNVAKRLLFGRIGVDSLAGPSEVLIIADASVPADWIAADLMAQAEHGAESKSIVITWSRVLADKILSSIGALCRLEPRSEWISQSLAARGALIVVEDEVEALRLTNLCAPEHLQLLVGNPQEWIGRVRHAGAIFAGSYSPVPLGDYAAGPSHTLPTGTSARFSSALGVAEFQKRTSLIWYDKNEYAEDAKAAVTLAEAEGLHAHATSLRLRMAED
ncbi:MAG: histidinol dehydrogenase, partial [Armatimonadota bacterium]